MRKQAQKELKKKARRMANNAYKKSARDTAVGIASQFVGRDAARGLYGAGAKTVKLARSYIPKMNSKEKRLVLSAVSSQYLKSYLTPFDQSVRTAHVPNIPSYPTYKAMGFVRGTAYIGTAGVGFVALSPCLANDTPAVYYSTAAYTQTVAAGPPADVFTTTGNATTPAIAFMTNLPFANASIISTTPGTKIEGRIVSAALRAEYSGTELNRSGMIYAYMDPDGDNVLGGNHNFAVAGNGVSIAELSSKEATEIYQVKKAYTTVLALPPNAHAYDFTNQNASLVRQNYPYSSGDNMTYGVSTSVGAAPVIIMFTGVAGMSIYFEGIVHVEYEGAGVTQSLLTESHSDVVGLDAVQNILSRAQRKAASDAQISFATALNRTMNEEKVVFGSGRRSVDY